MPLEIKDLAGLSEPLKKLIEVISQGVGAIYKPFLIKKTADAKAYEIKKIAQAIKESQTNIKEIEYSQDKLSLKSIDQQQISKEPDIIERTHSRIEYQEATRQENIEDITQKAASFLEEEQTVSEEKVDEDWTKRFFSYAQDVSNEEMQDLWARILSGEIKRPKSFSLRTLELIRNLSKSEAEVFNKAAKLRIYSHNSPFIFRGNDNDFLHSNSLTFEDRLLLVELGILQPDIMISRNLKSYEQPHQIIFEAGKFVIKLTREANAPEHQVPILRFSKIGEELLSLVISDPSMDYIKAFSKSIKIEKSTVEYAFIINRKDDNIQHTLPWLQFD